MEGCVWFYNKAGQYYVTSCCNQEIDEHDYIGTYCTCCGRKIIVPIVQYDCGYKKEEFNYANQY